MGLRQVEQGFSSIFANLFLEYWMIFQTGARRSVFFFGFRLWIFQCADDFLKCFGANMTNES